MKQLIALGTMFLCTATLPSSSRQAVAQTLESQVSAEWKALGWTLPESFPKDQLPFFKGLNAARGTWSFKGEAIDGERAAALTGNLVISGSSQGTMASAWNLIWFWPTEDPQFAIVENIIAMPEYQNQQFGLMLFRFGPVDYSNVQAKQMPKIQPSVFQGKWDFGKQSVSWTQKNLPGERGNQKETREEQSAAAFEMLVEANGKLSITNSVNLPSGQISTGKATERTGEWEQEAGEPKFLTGLHRIAKGSEITDPRIIRYLPAEATDIKLISDRSGHIAHYRISSEAFDKFFEGVWERYRKDRAAEPKRWVDYSEEEITEALKGSPLGRYEPVVQSAEMIFDKPIVWESLENATSYDGPRRSSAAGATYYLDRESGIVFQEAGYW